MKAFLFIGLLVLGGCASNQPKDAALLLVDQLDTYETALKSKISAEQTFYLDIRQALKASAERQAWVASRIYTRNRVTRLADRAIVQDKGMQVSVLQQFLRDENEQARLGRQQLEKQQAELEANYHVSFDSLTFRQRQLGRTRTKLLALTQDQEVKDQLIAFINEAGKMAVEMQEETKN